jgi:DNA-directed RNA polymerase specialized sigma24 family protein
MTTLAGAGRCDPSLIEAARGGDTEALVSLIAMTQPDVRRYAARNCRAADIDDAVQETLLLPTGVSARCAR